MVTSHPANRVPGPESSTLNYLTLSSQELCETENIIVPIFQMGTWRPTEVNSSENCEEGLSSSHLAGMSTIHLTPRVIPFLRISRKSVPSPAGLLGPLLLSTG